MRMPRLEIAHFPGPARVPPARLPARQGLRPYDYGLAVLAGLLALAFYLRTLAPGLLGGDSGEFQFAAWLAGFVHPTGYPLYLLLGHIWTHLLPWHDPAWRMNSFSALWGGIAVALTYLLELRLLKLTCGQEEGWGLSQRLVAFLIALTLAVTPTFWSQAVVAEVYTMHATFVAAVLLGLVAWEMQPVGRESYTPLYWAAACLGLGLAHHRSMLLLALPVMLYLWRGRRWGEAWRTRLGGLLRGIGLLLLPQLFYLYIPLRAPRVPYAQIALGPGQTLQLYQPTLGGFVAYIMGQVFTSALGSPVDAASRLWPSLSLWVQEVSWAGVLLGLIGLLWLWGRNRGLVTLTGLSFLFVVVFNLFYGIGDIRVFYIPAYLIWVLWMGLGLVALGQALAIVRRWRIWGQVALPVCALALPVWLLLSGYGRADQSQNQFARTTWQTILAQPIPQAAILISNDRDEMMPLWYLQYVEGIRPDLVGLFPLIQPTADWANVGRTIDTARRTGRPVLLIKPMPGLEIKFRLEEQGTLQRVLGPAVERQPQKPRVVNFADEIRLTGYDLEPNMVQDGGQVTIALYWQPLRHLTEEYTTFVHLVNAEGRVVGQSDHRPGGVFYPTSLWQPGELLLDIHRLSLAQDLGRAPFSIEVGLYKLAPGLPHLGQPTKVGLVARFRPADSLPEDPANRLGLRFDEQIALRGLTTNVHDSLLSVRFCWQALRWPKSDYAVFVHLTDQHGMMVAQYDGQPLGGTMPTSTWPAGYVLVDEVVIPLPADLPRGTYQISGGLYDPVTLGRLSITDEDGHPLGSSLQLGQLTWPPAR